MTTEDTAGKVLKFRDPNYALFNPTFRKRVERELSSTVDKPAEAVDALERAICTAIISVFRNLATKLGVALGERINATTQK